MFYSVLYKYLHSLYLLQSGIHHSGIEYPFHFELFIKLLITREELSVQIIQVTVTEEENTPFM